MQSKSYPANGNAKGRRQAGQKSTGSGQFQPSHQDAAPVVKKISFEDNRLLTNVFGQHDCNLAHLEEKLGIVLINRGNEVSINGSPASGALAEKVLSELYHMARQGHHIDLPDVDGVVRMLSGDRGDVAQQITTGRGSSKKPSDSQGDLKINTRNRVISPRTPAQAHYIRAMMKDDMVFGVGPAGTGKTYLAVALAVSNMIAGNVDRIILSRPAVEAGESLGFLPGDLKDKIDPYLRPLYDALYDMLPAEQVAKKMASGEIEIAPLAYMRGRTLANCFVILDEAQNTTSMQMKMILTRFGENSKMVICGDPSQVDLPGGSRSGLGQALDLLRETDGIGITRFTSKDVVRHPLVARIIDAYDNDPRKD